MARVFPARAWFGAACALASAVSCFAQTSQVRISQIFTGGGSSANAPRADYVELFNAGDTPVTLAGWSVQTAAFNGLAWNVTALNGSVAPRSYYLVQIGGNQTTGTTFTPDAGPGNGNLNNTGGKVALVSATSGLSGRPNCPFPVTIVDFVGYGNADQTRPCNSGVNAPSITAQQAVLRRCAGKADVGSAFDVFQTGTPTPRNSASPANTAPDVMLVPGPSTPIRAYVNEQILLDVTATASACAGAITTVSADLSPIGGPAIVLNRFGATNSWQSLIDLAAFTPAPGRYLIPVKAGVTRLTEQAATTVELLVRPANDECATAQPFDSTLGPTVFAIGNDGALADGIAGACSTTGEKGVWFRFTAPPSAPAGGQLSITEESSQDAALAVFSGSCDSMATVACTTSEQTQVAVSPGVAYFVLVSRQSEGGSPTLSVRFAFTPAVPPPANDTCASALVFDVAQVTTFFGTNNNGALSDIDVGDCTPSTIGDKGVWYRFTSPATPTPVPGTVTISEESSQDVAIGVFRGTCGSLTPVLCTASEQTQVQTAPSTTYYVLIVRDPATQNDAKPLGVRMSFSVTPPPPPPPGPANDAVCAAQSLTLGIDAAGTTENASAENDGPTVACSSGNIGGGRGVWYRFIPPSGAQYRFSTCGSTTDTDLALFRVTGCPGAPAFNPVLGACDTNSCINGVAAQINATTLLAGENYYLRVSNPAGAAAGTHTVRVEAISTGACCDPDSGSCTASSTGSCAPGSIFQGAGSTCTPNPCITAGNDDCAGAFPLQLGVPVTGNTLTATTTASLNTFPCATGGTDGKDVFFTFTPSLTVLFDITACGSSFDTVLSVHSACPPTTSNRLICNDNAVPSCDASQPFSSRIPQVQLLSGHTYYIRIAGFQNDAGPYRIAVNGTGVCCRGSTCNAALSTPDACFGSMPAGSGVGVQFASAGGGCNTVGILTTPCCHGDFNKSGGVSVDDLFSYVNRWFEGNVFCDISSNGASAPGVDDLFQFLSAYFSGCQ